MTMPDNTTVTYSVKELLAAIRDDQTKGFATLSEALNHKASTSDVAQIQNRLADIDARLATVEAQGISSEAERRGSTTANRENREWRRFIWPVALTAGLLIDGILPIILHH